MLNEYELQQAAADRARYCAPAPEPHVPAEPSTTPQDDELIVVHKDSLRAVIDRCEKAMQGIPLGSADLNLDAPYIDVCVAWAHARHMLRGTRPNAGQPLSDLEPKPVPQLRLVERTSVSVDEAMPCPGCVDRCGQCAAG